MGKAYNAREYAISTYVKQTSLPRSSSVSLFSPAVLPSLETRKESGGGLSSLSLCLFFVQSIYRAVGTGSEGGHYYLTKEEEGRPLEMVGPIPRSCVRAGGMLRPLLNKREANGEEGVLKRLHDRCTTYSKGRGKKISFFDIQQIVFCEVAAPKISQGLWGLRVGLCSHFKRSFFFVGHATTHATKSRAVQHGVHVRFFFL